MNIPSPARRTVPLTLVVVALLITAGAAVVVTAAFYELQPSSGSPGGSQSISIVDDLGRKVTAPVNAQRIVALAPSIMDILYRLGLRDRVIGVGCTPSIAGGILNEYSPNQTALWNLNSSLCITDYPSVDAERVAELDPQLVLASTITSPGDVATLTSTYKIPVVILSPSTLSEIISDVGLVSLLFPTSQPIAQALEVSLDSVLNNATTFDNELSANGTPIPTVLLTYYFDTGNYYSYGSGSFGSSLIDLAGGNSIAGNFPFAYVGVNASAVLDIEPQIILYGTSWNDPYLVVNETPSAWNTAPYWNQLNGTKIPVDATLLTEADPTMLLALPLYMHWLHPSLAPVP